MQQSEDDKKLVQKYKQTNKALRQQLLSLSDQIDRILVKKSNTVGLKKLPQVSKMLTDPKILETEVQILRKRLEQLQKDKKKYEQKTSTNLYDQIRKFQDQLSSKNVQKEQLKKKIKLQQRQQKKSLIKNNITSNNEVLFLQRIEKLNDQINRLRKIQKQLKKQISEQQVNENRKNDIIVRKQEQNKQLSRVSPQKMAQISVNVKPITQSNITQEQWRDLKKQFLQLKQSKQQQEMYLYQENDNLRRQIRQLQIKIKQKKGRMDYLKNSSLKRAKNYSTLQNKKQSRNFRYRDKNSSVQYHRNTIQI